MWNCHPLISINCHSSQKRNNQSEMTTAYHCDDAGDRFRLPFLLVLATNTGGTLAVQFESRGTSKWLNSQVYKYRSISRKHQQKSETADMPFNCLQNSVYWPKKNEDSSNSSMTHWFLGTGTNYLIPFLSWWSLRQKGGLSQDLFQHGFQGGFDFSFIKLRRPLAQKVGGGEKINDQETLLRPMINNYSIISFQYKTPRWAQATWII